MTLQLFWFLIVGVLFVGYFTLDGFDFGVGMSLRVIGKTDSERRQIINSIGPVWDMNETWVIVAGACLFAAFPEWYSTLFSGAYLALFLILIALILRGVSFEYRHQRPGSRWTNLFDWFITIGSAVPALLWGVAVANIINGLPIIATEAGVAQDGITSVTGGHVFTGNLLTLLANGNGYALRGGRTTLLRGGTHGGQYLALKTDTVVRERAQRLGRGLGVLTIVVAAAFLLWTVLAHFSVIVLVCAALAAVFLITGVCANWVRRDGLAFTSTALTVVFAVLTLWLTLATTHYVNGTLTPMALPSTTDPVGTNSLTLMGASSSHPTLVFMTWVVCISLPIVLIYQGWTYWVFRKRVSHAQIVDADAAAAH